MNMTLHTNRFSKVCLIIFFSLISYIGIKILLNDEVAGCFVLIFGLIGIFVFLIQMLPGASYLKLDDKGFECKTIYRSKYVNWEDVEIFFPFGVARFFTFPAINDQTVAWKLKKKSCSKRTYRILGADDCLPENYGLNVNDLVEILNRERIKHSKHNKSKHLDCVNAADV